MKEDIKEIVEDYKQLAGEITLKLDNTAEYESWLIIQDYVDRFLDYITNLQKEIQKKDAYIKYLNEKTPIQGKVFYGDAREVLQDRIDKAIDNLKRNYYINEHEHNDDVVNLSIEILTGGEE